MFADSVVGLRAKLAKSKEVTELTCLNLFCASSCLAALATGCQPAARGRLAGCALGCRETLRKKLVNSRRRPEEPANREASVSWWSHFCTNKRQSSRVWVCKVHINVWVGMVLEFGFECRIKILALLDHMWSRWQLNSSRVPTWILVRKVAEFWNRCQLRIHLWVQLI
jgi:hypothetical protein